MVVPKIKMAAAKTDSRLMVAVSLVEMTSDRNSSAYLFRTCAAEISFLQTRIVGELRWLAVQNDAPQFEYDGVVRYRKRLARILFDQQNGQTVAVELANEIE